MTVLTREELDRRFSEFVYSLEDGEVITEAVMFFASVDPETSADVTTYENMVFGSPAIHHIVGLIEICKAHIGLGVDDA